MIKVYFAHMYTGKTDELIRQASELDTPWQAFYATGDDNHMAPGTITSRTGASIAASKFSFSDIRYRSYKHTIFIDEVQFMSPQSIYWLRELVRLKTYNKPDEFTEHGLDVVCFGLLRDYSDSLFPASEALLRVADEVVMTSFQYNVTGYSCDVEYCRELIETGFHRYHEGKWLVVCSYHKDKFPRTLPRGM